METIEITTSAGLQSIYTDWAALWERVAGSGPFQHPDWLLPWWRHVGREPLLVISMREQGELVALAPFYIHVDNATGSRQLTQLGNGISDTCDVLADTSRAHVMQSVAERLSALRAQGAWNNCDFRDLPRHSSLIPMMRRAFGATITEDEPRVSMGLEGWANEDGVLPGKIRLDLRRRRKRAEEIGQVRLELVTEARLSDAIEDLFRLHAARWKLRGQAGVLNQSNIDAFHRDVIGRFAKRGWLRLYRLHVGSRVAAVNYGFCLKRRAYSYIGGFDPDFSRLGAGRIIMHEIVRQAVAEGATQFDFLRGREDYKLRWGGKIVPQYRIQSHHVPVAAAPRTMQSDRISDATSHL